MYIYIVVGYEYGDMQDYAKNLAVTSDADIILTAKPENYSDEIDYIMVEVWKDGKIYNSGPKILRMD